MRDVELIVEPDDGVAPILNAIRHSKECLDITIFRFDHRGIAEAIAEAVTRGVRVRALIAAASRRGRHHLRQLEWGLLASGVTVSRASNTFTRYHAKMMIVDGCALHVHGFNCTHQDLASRSLGVVTTNRMLVHQAMRLFEADLTHRPFDGGLGGLVVSPENAREGLEAFVNGARRQLLIYDSKLTDGRFIRLLEERMKANVDIRVIGHVQGHRPLPSRSSMGDGFTFEPSSGTGQPRSSGVRACIESSSMLGGRSGCSSTILRPSDRCSRFSNVIGRKASPQSR